MKLRTVMLLPLLLVACAQGVSDANGGAGATNSSSAGSGGNAGASLPDSSSGNSSVAGDTSAGGSAAGDSASGQAGAATGGGGASGGGASGGGAGVAGAAGGNAGASSAGAAGSSGSASGGVGGGGSMLQDGIQPYFKPSDTTTATAISAILGELHVVNTDGGNATLSLLKVRYYFTNEGTMPLMQMNWAHLTSPGNQLDVPYMATVVKMTTPTPTADSYIEFACNSANVLDAGKEAVVSFRLYDGTNQPVFLQNNDYSFSAAGTPSDKIVLLYRDVVIWGVAP
ncbi:MAG TPA: cellulose binding domain-containing protein [Polyangiaceae bacterium]|nr:cellulose binding domain-containing protein [Polyangiaceae bacterium]